METPLLALQSIFRLRPHTIEYLPLACLMFSLGWYPMLSFQAASNKDFSTQLVTRSQSERDETAQRFLEKNFPKPCQLLGEIGNIEQQHPTSRILAISSGAKQICSIMTPSH